MKGIYNYEKDACFFGMFFIILVFNPTISAVDEEQSSDSKVPQFAVELLENINQYSISFKNDDRYFDFEAAIAKQEGDLIIQSGEAFNSIKTENETSPYLRLRIPRLSYRNYFGPCKKRRILLMI